ncbi:YgaP family membrane protein [Natrinema thermotolerans]
MQRNVGGLDRIVRAVLGSWVLAVAVAALVAGRRATAAVLAVGAAGLLFNATVRFCGGNYLLGIDTTDDGSCSRE